MKTIKKIMLFIPPAVTFKARPDINPLPPLGLGYLAAVLENNGIEVRIVDCLVEGWGQRVELSPELVRVGLSFEQIKAAIADFRPDIVGVNNLFTRQRANAHEIYRVAKQVDRQIITVAGGAHPTAMPELVLADPELDYVVMGEGERAIMDLVRFIEGKADVASLDGIGLRQDGQLKIIPRKGFIEDLDSLPLPAWHLFSMEKYFGLKESHGDRKKKKFFPVISSRGCPAKCTFCSAFAVWGRGFRARSPENVLNELRILKECYGIEEIMFEDDNLTLDPRRAELIFDGMIREKFGFQWDTPNGIAAWTLTEQLLDKMKQSGCRQVNFALESGSQYVLDHIIKKPLKLEKVKPLVRYARKIGLDVGIFLVIGMPGETEAQMWESFRLAEELGIYTPHISIATPYPGSELYRICKDQGYLREDFSLDDLHIRSFSILATGFEDEKLKKVLSEGQRYLLLAFLKREPFRFFWTGMGKVAKAPRLYAEKIFRFICSRDWGKLR